MAIQAIKDQLGDFAKDTKLNLSSVLTEEGAPDLKKNQIFGIALASAYATKDRQLVAEILSEAKEILSDAEINAAKAAATIMGMNNVYYRFQHLVSDKDYTTMPARLRMNVIGNPGVKKLDFELYSLAVSAINGCGRCIDAHADSIVKEGLSKTGVQSTVRIASVISAAAQGLFINSL